MKNQRIKQNDVAGLAGFLDDPQWDAVVLLAALDATRHPFVDGAFRV